MPRLLERRGDGAEGRDRLSADVQALLEVAQPLLDLPSQRSRFFLDLWPHGDEARLGREHLLEDRQGSRDHRGAVGGIQEAQQRLAGRRSAGAAEVAFEADLQVAEHRLVEGLACLARELQRATVVGRLLKEREATSTRELSLASAREQADLVEPQRLARLFVVDFGCEQLLDVAQRALGVVEQGVRRVADAPQLPLQFGRTAEAGAVLGEV